MTAEVLKELEILLDTGEYLPEPDQVKELLEKFINIIVEVGASARHEANEVGAYETLCDVWKFYCDSGEDEIRVLAGDAVVLHEVVLRALASITPGNPGLVNKTIFVILYQTFNPAIPASSKVAGMKVLRNICIKSEKNRDVITFNSKILPKFLDVIRVEDPEVEFVRQWCGALKAITLNDDPSVPHNRSVERKQKIFQAGVLSYLVGFLTKFLQIQSVLNSIVVAITMMATREDHCVAIQAAGALPAIEEILNTYSENERLVMNAVSCLRYLSVCGIVREAIGSTLLIKSVIGLAEKMHENSEHVELLMSCLAYMTLRCPCTSAQFLTEQGVPFTVEIMKKYIDNREILKPSCLLLRNIAGVAGRVGQVNVLDAGGENILRIVQQKHEDLAENYVTPALKDLGFEVPSDKMAGNPFIPDRLNERVAQRLAM